MLTNVKYDIVSFEKLGPGFYISSGSMQWSTIGW